MSVSFVETGSTDFLLHTNTIPKNQNTYQIDPTTLEIVKLQNDPTNNVTTI